jgi:hypothetical protein
LHHGLGDFVRVAAVFLLLVAETFQLSFEVGGFAGGVFVLVEGGGEAGVLFGFDGKGAHQFLVAV